MYVADIETVKFNDGSMGVWLTDVCELYTFKHITFCSFYDFILWAQSSADVLYFHNLKHDGPFLMYALNDNGYTFSSERKLLNRQYNMLVTDRNVWFMGSVKWSTGNETEIRDSYKKIPLSVRAMAKKYGLPMSKGEIDYKKDRNGLYVPTPDEVDYIRRDTEIVARVLTIHLQNGMTKLTMPADALENYKTTVNFEKLFCTKFYYTHKDVESFIRKSYSGGISWVNPDIKEKIVTHGFVVDYNSMYPSVMITYPMPCGIPFKFYGKPKKPLYVARIQCHIYRDPEKIACIRDPYTKTWIENEFEGELVLTSVDLENMEECYYGEYKIIEGYEWDGTNGVFDEYINKWGEIKRTTHDPAERQLSKLYQNSLYGKFGMNPLRAHKEPEFVNGILKWHTCAPEEGKCVNVAIAAFITAGARRELVKGANSSYGFCYSDTDSLHLASLNGKCAKFGGIIHPSNYCAWKKEYNFVRAKYLRQKTYIEEESNGKLHIAACGCPDDSKNYITFDNFKIGASYKGKLRSAMRVGGVELVESRFTIREPLRAF